MSTCELQLDAKSACGALVMTIMRQEGIHLDMIALTAADIIHNALSTAPRLARAPPMATVVGPSRSRSQPTGQTLAVLVLAYLSRGEDAVHRFRAVQYDGRIWCR